MTQRAAGPARRSGDIACWLADHRSAGRPPPQVGSSQPAFFLKDADSLPAAFDPRTYGSRGKCSLDAPAWPAPRKDASPGLPDYNDGRGNLNSLDPYIGVQVGGWGWGWDGAALGGGPGSEDGASLSIRSLPLSPPDPCLSLSLPLSVPLRPSLSLGFGLRRGAVRGRVRGRAQCTVCAPCFVMAGGPFPVRSEPCRGPEAALQRASGPPRPPAEKGTVRVADYSGPVTSGRA
jgi:hypothetical protein